MRIGFYAQGEGPHRDIAKYLIASARRVMPDVEVFQLTDETTPKLEGVNGAIRLPGNLPMGVRRVSIYSMLEGDWCFVDTDVVFCKDVREVFERPFDVALVSRDGTYMEGTKYAQAMPYNFGVVFSRNPKFWEMLLPHLLKMSPRLQEWGGEQLLTCQLANQALSCFSVEILPSTYNFTPERKADDLSHVHIAHFKGPRKAWITTHP